MCEDLGMTVGEAATIAATVNATKKAPRVVLLPGGTCPQGQDECQPEGRIRFSDCVAVVAQADGNAFRITLLFSSVESGR